MYKKTMAAMLGAVLACCPVQGAFAEDSNPNTEPATDIEKEMQELSYHAPAAMPGYTGNIDLPEPNVSEPDMVIPDEEAPVLNTTMGEPDWVDKAPQEEEEMGPITVYAKVQDVTEKGFTATTHDDTLPNIVWIDEFYAEFGNAVITGLDGEALTSDAIHAGDMIELTFNTMIPDSVKLQVKDVERIQLWQQGKPVYNIDHLYRMWEKNGYPDHVCGFYYLNDQERLVGLLEDTPEAEAAILAQVKNTEDIKIVFCQGKYSYNFLKQIHNEITDGMINKTLDGVISCGTMTGTSASTPSWDGTGDIPDMKASYRMDNHVEVGVLDESGKIEDYKKYFAEKYGDAVVVEEMSVAIDCDDAESELDTPDVAPEYDEAVTDTMGIDNTIDKDIAPAPALNKKKVTLKAGKTKKLSLGVSASEAKKIKWKSSKKSVVKVNKNGKIKALKKGKAVITASYGGNTYKCTVKVKNK